MKRSFRTFTSIAALTMAAGLCAPISAQIVTAAGTNRALDLADDSPFRDPDIIYLEADDLINDEIGGILTATGQVEGRYQDRTLRSDNVVYNLNTGIVIATGNVVLIDATGSVQYADKLELSDELEAGTAANFTSRTPTGGTTAARFVTRNEKEEIELYNAYYTACKVCVDSEGNTKKPAWRLKARRVRQDKDTRTIRYNDAVFEFLGVPVFYTPYLAHPDPSEDRASGLLAPFGGISGNRGFEIETPYYWAIDDYTEATFTPRFFSGVNPLLEYQAARQFNTGKIEVEGSLTYGSIFDRNGNAFDDPALFADPTTAPVGQRLRSHFNASGEFNPNDTWAYGFGVQLTTDDNFLQRYDIPEQFDTPGLIARESRRNVSQAYLLGQDDDFRFAITAAGFQDLRSRVLENQTTGLFQTLNIDDSTLPIIAPRIEAEKYFTDPILGGRAKAFGDFTALTREVGTDYLRATAGIDYAKSTILPGGIEAKAFGNARFDQFDIGIEGLDADEDGQGAVDGTDVSFSRGLAQVGADVRYPFVKQSGGVTWILEPRAQATYSFGNGKLDNFENVDANGTPISLFQDGIAVDFDQALFWQSNKSTGFDFWQEGFRADVGAAIRADWGPFKNAELFVGQSYASNTEGNFAIGSGLENDKSDIVGLFSTNLSRSISANARLRFDEDSGSLRRVDANVRYSGKKFGVNARYFRIDNAANDLTETPLAPLQEVSGSTYLQLTENWRTTYRASYDIDANTLRRQSVGLGYTDDCTRIELLYTRNSFDNDLIRDTGSFGIRISLLTLGDFGASSADFNEPVR